MRYLIVFCVLGFVNQGTMLKHVTVKLETGRHTIRLQQQIELNKVHTVVPLALACKLADQGS